MNKVVLIPLFLIATFLPPKTQAQNFFDEIPIIGIDDAGNPIEIFVSQSEYQEKMALMIDSVQESTLPNLNKRTSTKDSNLRTVVVGIGLSIEAGLAQIFTAGAIARFKIAFSNSSDPVLP